jgi:hypothetical protein
VFSKLADEVHLFHVMNVVYETAIIKNSEEHQQLAGIDLVSYRMSFQSYHIVAIQILSKYCHPSSLYCTLDHYLYIQTIGLPELV